MIFYLPDHRKHSLLLLLILASATYVDAGTISRNETEILLDEIESYRKLLLDLPSKYFDLEERIDRITTDENLREKMSELRSRTLNFPGEFIELELAVKRMFNNMTLQAEEPKMCGLWQLGMNLNPSDGHIMDYTTGWSTGETIGTPSKSLEKDYLNHRVWREPADYIAIARHQQGILDAVKVFRFSEWGLSLLDRFNEMNPGRHVVTRGGPIQESYSVDAENLIDDPIFSVEGDVAFNWVYSNNGNRVVLTGAHLSGAEVNDDATHGFGNHFNCDCRNNVNNDSQWKHEISNIQSGTQVQQGTDHGNGPKLQSGPIYGNYAIYISQNAKYFPDPGFHLEPKIKMC